MEPTPTPFEKRCEILAELWMGYRDVDYFADFIEYNDLGLPLAYALANGIALRSDLSNKFINETWDLFLAGLETEDYDYDNLNDVLGYDR